MKKTNLSGIFAAALIAVTIFTLASCSQDDEYYYDSEMFTRSEEMMTRGGEQGGYTPTLTPVLNDTVYTNYTFRFETDNQMIQDSLPTTFDVKIDVMLYRVDGEIAVEMMAYSIPYNISGPHEMIKESFNTGGVYFELDSPLPNRYRMCASGSMLDNFARVYGFKGVVPNLVFG